MRLFPVSLRLPESLKLSLHLGPLVRHILLDVLVVSDHSFFESSGVPPVGVELIDLFVIHVAERVLDVLVWRDLVVGSNFPGDSSANLVKLGMTIRTGAERVFVFALPVVGSLRLAARRMVSSCCRRLLF